MADTSINLVSAKEPQKLCLIKNGSVGQIIHFNTVLINGVYICCFVIIEENGKEVGIYRIEGHRLFGPSKHFKIGFYKFETGFSEDDPEAVRILPREI